MTTIYTKQCDTNSTKVYGISTVIFPTWRLTPPNLQYIIYSIVLYCVVL